MALRVGWTFGLGGQGLGLISNTLIMLRCKVLMVKKKKKKKKKKRKKPSSVPRQQIKGPEVALLLFPLVCCVSRSRPLSSRARMRSFHISCGDDAYPTVPEKKALSRTWGAIGIQGKDYVQKQYRQIFKELEVPNCVLDRIFHYVRLIWLNRFWIDCQYRLRRPVKANTLLAFLGDLLHEQGLYLLC